MEENKDKQLVDLLNQLVQIQAQITAIISTRFERQSVDKVQNKVSQKQINISKEAKRYGQDPNLAKDAVAEYSEALERIRREYSTEKNMWLAQSEEFQINEIKYILEIAKLKKELKDTKKRVVQNKNKNLETQPEKNNIDNMQEKDEDSNYKQKILDSKEKVKKYREASKESKANIKDCQNRCEHTIEDISEDKEMVKTNNKQNIFSKIFSKIIDKIGGKNKFNKNVIEPLKEKVAHIKNDVLPTVKDKIKQNVMSKLKFLLEKGKEKVNEMNLKEKFSKLMSIAKEGAKIIIEKNIGMKGKEISTFLKGVSLAKEGISLVAEKVSNVTKSKAER